MMLIIFHFVWHVGFVLCHSQHFCTFGNHFLEENIDDERAKEKYHVPISDVIGNSCHGGTSGVENLI